MNIIELTRILKEKYSDDYISSHPDEIKQEYDKLFDIEKEITLNKIVWFTIVKGEYSNEYSIAIYYENEYNIANGEDL